MQRSAHTTAGGCAGSTLRWELALSPLRRLISFNISRLWESFVQVAALHSLKKVIHLPIAAHPHTFGFVELTVIVPVHTDGIAILKDFHRQVKAPNLAIDADVGKGIERSFHSNIIHEVIGKILFHVGRISLHIVDDNFIKAQPCLPGDVMIKLDLKAISVCCSVLATMLRLQLPLGRIPTFVIFVPSMTTVAGMYSLAVAFWSILAHSFHLL